MTAVAAPAEFDLCGPLPSGLTVLEASAGTGKTYTIAALAARYVAEGTPLERMLLITFTRSATGELRDRVRERLVASERALSRTLAGAADADDDAITKLLATGEAQEIGQRRDRLTRAIADFDAATIATTHGFCQEVLAELGTVGDLEPGTVFVENVGDLLEEVVDDLYVRKFARRTGAPFTRAEALKIAQAAVSHPMAELEPKNEQRDSDADLRHRLADAVRKELEVRKRRRAIMTYDDLLTRLNATLDGPNRDAARARLRSRFTVVLVDEFQDTDPIQWQILYRAFHTEGVTLVLIADPKQAIYAFRGADVYAYLIAAQAASTQATLPVNRRSDQPLLDAYDALFVNARLGHEGIVYRQIRAAPEHRSAALPGAPLRIRLVPRDQPSIETTTNGFASAPSARTYIAKDLAAVAVELLDNGPLCPRDLAVLVRTNRSAELVREELQAANVPAVINGAGSVFATDAARDWLRLLEATEQPASTLRTRAAALTPFLGWSAERIATAPEQEWAEIHAMLHRWSRIAREQGMAELAEAITVATNLPARVLALVGGERELTDLRHVAQLLHRAATAERLGVTALRGWLARRIAESADDTAEEERTRRLESDAEAVQVLTIHRSKGLEFPVVLCPFLWDTYRSERSEPVLFHDAAMGDRCTIDVGLEGGAFKRHQRQQTTEQAGEDLRLAYVALTRAKHQAIIWWAGSRDGRHSPLSRLVFDRQPDGNVPADGRTTPADREALARFNELRDSAPEGIISVEQAILGTPPSWTPPLDAPGELRLAAFDRPLDLRWRRTSYSDLTADAHDALVSSEPEESVVTDEPEAPTPAPGADAGARALPELDRISPMAHLPVGTAFGTFAHRVLEATDFAAGDLAAELAAHGDPAPDLKLAIETPLGPALDSLRLRDIRRADRLDELDFELPLVGGDDPTARLTLRAIADVLRQHADETDALWGYADRLADPALRSTVRGFLTGSIDLVIRLASGRFAIVDYKTNWLGTGEEELTLHHYTPAAVAAEMARAHYGLQALLYAVALHRYLRWRLADYDPDRHLAGVLYLFLRGMAGADTPVVDGSPCGVFTWRPTGSLITALSDVLDTGQP